MKKLVILGAGTAGTMVANRLVRTLKMNEWQITLVDKDPVHYYQPGWLFVPFGIYDKKDCFKPKSKYIPSQAKMIQADIQCVEPENNRVILTDRTVLEYDYLIIATGADIYPDETPGLNEGEWGKSIHTFYSMDGAVALADKLRNWKGGRLVVNVVENPIKCPVAPLEFLMLADWFFHQRGMRDRVELIYATPLPGAFTKPIANKKLSYLLETKNILVEPEFMIERADPDAKKIVSYDEREVEYDLLVSVPLNKGADYVGRSGLGDALNYVPVNKHTLLSNKHNNIFVLGDASNIPASKAGSVAHYAIDLFGENFVRYLEGKEMHETFDGHANCFVESGYGKGLLIDFNYTQEPLPGRFPIPVLGPMKLLEESRLNHLGKLAFRSMYWNILMRGLSMPLPPTMSMAGKWTN
ncbi:MAG TPA: FAD/NAD(P)-binding oxidoreductase [Anaerolineaceae bacterium]